MGPIRLRPLYYVSILHFPAFSALPVVSAAAAVLCDTTGPGPGTWSLSAPPVIPLQSRLAVLQCLLSVERHPVHITFRSACVCVCVVCCPSHHHHFGDGLSSHSSESPRATLVSGCWRLRACDQLSKLHNRLTLFRHIHHTLCESSTNTFLRAARHPTNRTTHPRLNNPKHISSLSTTRRVRPVRFGPYRL